VVNQQSHLEYKGFTLGLQEKLNFGNVEIVNTYGSD